ncbi:MAG: hypothetical protein IT204_19200 [Fimbriimonadaceae bacterium]|nr:hypothetical protein [Fimbriimonadaceae bacterium]
MAVALLVLVEFGLARQDWLWNWDAKGEAAPLWRLQRDLIDPSPAPTVLLFGSSRAQIDLVPAVLAAELGVAQASVYNLAISAGTPFDAWVVYRESRAKLRQAMVAVIGIDNWHVNAGFGVNPRDRRYADLPTRWRLFDGGNRLSLLTGYFWRTCDAQQPLRQFATSLGRRLPASLPELPDGRRIPESSHIPGPTPHVELPSELQLLSVVQAHYVNYRASDFRFRQLEQFLALAKADGLRTVVVTMPPTRPYLDLVEQRRPGALAWFDRAVDGIRGADRVWRCRDNLAAGLALEAYYDGGHMNDVGAAAFSRSLAAVVLSELAARP